jgi:hypothetical protein
MGDGKFRRKEVRHIGFAGIVSLRTEAALREVLADTADASCLFTCFRAPALFPACKGRRPDL